MALEAPPRDKDERDESASRDKEFGALLQELRVLLPGVQVLLAFLLTVPFSARYGRLTGTQTTVFFVAFMSAAVASILLIGPTVYHRVRWREAHKEDVLRRAHVMALVATGLLGVAIASVVYIVTDVVYGSWFPALGTALVVTAAVSIWYLLPLADRARGGSSRPARDAGRHGARKR